ncbi:probable E3 ubiquitin-protein ligase sinah [Anabrus simplex]|uniref:probable E3 ubiquitin-protein ligase sinah n=1 Tax=Anabrus simplex TaxID=316456 RepID=UPI0034DD740A
MDSVSWCLLIVRLAVLKYDFRLRRLFRSFLLGNIRLFTMEEKVEKKIFESNGFSQELLKLMECCVCYKPMAPPILQCTNGHSICSECKAKVKKCPICNASSLGIRNLLAESLASKLPYPCNNADVGCNVMVMGSELKEHGRKCPYRMYCCPVYCDCEWKGRISEILSHVKDEHDDCWSCESVNKLKFTFSEESEMSNTTLLISVWGELFVFNREVIEGTSDNYFFVEYLGEEEKRLQYKIHFQFKSGDQNHSLHFSTVPFCDSYNEMSIEPSEKCLVMNKGLCSLLVNGKGEILYKLIIVRADGTGSDDEYVDDGA